MKRLASDLISRMSELTAVKSVDLAMANTRLNGDDLGRTIADLVDPSAGGRSGSAIVIAAGPSLHRANPVEEILSSEYDGPIVAVDGSLGYCLRNGLVPDYMVTLDPHPTRIVRWFGDPDLDQASAAADCYFTRQDLDPHLGVRELEHNRELIDLVNEHGPRIKAVIATCVAPRVTQRCLDAGMELYWWNPLYDDFKSPLSVSRTAYELNGAPCMATGGNCGSAAWVFANMVLGKREVALVGMDLSYAPGTLLRNTQYFEELEELFGEKAADAFVEVYNPHIDQTWFADPTYYWYRESFLEMARDSDCVTYNCSEGGIVFGEGVEFTPLSRFLREHAREKGAPVSG